VRNSEPPAVTPWAAPQPLQLYDFGDDVWTRKAPLPEARFRFDAAHVDQRVYVYGGQPTCTNSPKDNEALGR
jgi:hypothetical protein